MYRKFETKKRIPSGFISIDTIAGGYIPGTPTIIRSVDKYDDGDSLQRFIESQITRFAVHNGIKTLVISIRMDMKDTVKSLMLESKNNLEALSSAPIFISDKNNKDVTPEELLQNIKISFAANNFGAIIIDAAELIFKNVENKEKSSYEFLNNMKDILEGKDIPVLLTDYENILETGYPNQFRFPEIELNTDVLDRLQATIIAEGERDIIEDVYGANFESAGVNIINAERRRQVIMEGYLPEHDMQHKNGELADAAAAYAITETTKNTIMRINNDVPFFWPFEKEYYKPTPHDRIRQLAKAGAFIAAEIDRLKKIQ